jgi:hypothetical protein
MTLGTGMTNPYGTDLTLTAWGVDQFVFLAIGGNLELQPEWVSSGGGDGIQLAPNSEYGVKYHWYGKQSTYENLSQYYVEEENDTAYFTTLWE